MTDAPAVEERLWHAVHTYEKVKLGIVSLTMLVVLAIGVLLLVGQRKQQESLTILKCAVSQEIQDARAKAGSNIELRDIYARRAYEACTKRGGPKR